MEPSAATRLTLWPLLSCLACLIPASSQAQASLDDALQRRCWQRYTAERVAHNLNEPVVVSFTNLKNNYTVRAPFWVDFGVRGMGVIPAGNAHNKAGHHHILVNKALPTVHTEKIPFNDAHRHFGKGQTGAALDLPVGKHTLRLLFADHEHRPHFAFSPEITVEVIGKRSDAAPRIDDKNFDASCATWYQDTVTAPRPAAAGVYVKNLLDGEQVPNTVRVSLGVTSLGVAPAGSNIKDTGHFALAVSQGGKTVSRKVWSDGRTEAVLDLPLGEVQLLPEMLTHDGKPALKGDPVRLVVRSPG
jgi:Domain of unknown function (DUF4399)